MSVNATTTVSIAPVSTSCVRSSNVSMRRSYALPDRGRGGGPWPTPSRISTSSGLCRGFDTRGFDLVDRAFEPAAGRHHPPDAGEQDHGADEQRCVLDVAVVPLEPF